MFIFGSGRSYVAQTSWVGKTSSILDFWSYFYGELLQYWSLLRLLFVFPGSYFEVAGPT